MAASEVGWGTEKQGRVWRAGLFGVKSGDGGKLGWVRARGCKAVEVRPVEQLFNIFFSIITR